MASGLLDEAKDHAEPQAGPLAGPLGREKWVKDACEHLWRYTGAGVADLDYRVVARGDLIVARSVFGVERDVMRLNHQASAFRHRIPRVDRDVHQRGLELRFINLHGPQAVCELHIDGKVAAERSRHQL